MLALVVWPRRHPIRSTRTAQVPGSESGCVPDPIDARARLVIFADRGLAAKEVARRTEVAVQDEWTRHLGRRATARLHQLLTQLREITEPYR